MKYSTVAVAAAYFASRVAAFPAIADEIARAENEINDNVKRQGVPDPGLGRFNAKLQYVSNKGAHKFVAPNLATDARGPCPGLNAMANHGYLPHNGVGTHTDFIFGTNKVFGMAPDLSGFLTVLGGTIDGDGLSWSIGGPNKALPGLPPLLGRPQGISGSHNKYEGDASPGRGDLYLNGDDFTLQPDQFQQLHDMGVANGDDIDLDLLNEFRSMRFDHSVQKNPYFFNGPFTGILVQPAAYEFIYRFMSNKSAEHPAGKLNTNVLRSFFGVTQKNGKLTVVPGHERIPDNWYKRAIGDGYSIPFLNTDTVLAATRYPKFLNIGGNQGKPNSFAGVSVNDLTGGAMNAQSLLEGNNLSCFASQFATQLSPDLIKCSGVLADITGNVAKLNAQMAKVAAALTCPKLSLKQTGQFNKFPGVKNLDCKSGKYPAPP